MRALLVVTEDGFGKRVPLSDFPANKRGAKGVRMSASPVAAALAVDGDDGDVVIVTASGKVERIALTAVPVRRRSSVAKGNRLVRLTRGDRVAAVALGLARDASQTAPKTNRTDMWPCTPVVGLEPGERVSGVVVLRPLKPLHEIKPGGRPAKPRSTVSRGGSVRLSK